MCLLAVLSLTTCDGSCLLSTWQTCNHTGDKALTITGREFLNWVNEAGWGLNLNKKVESDLSPITHLFSCDCHVTRQMFTLLPPGLPCHDELHLKISLAPRTVKASLSLTKAFPKQAFVRYFVKAMRKVTNTSFTGSIFCNFSRFSSNVHNLEPLPNAFMFKLIQLFPQNLVAWTKASWVKSSASSYWFPLGQITCSFFTLVLCSTEWEP